MEQRKKRYNFYTILGCCLLYAAVSGASANCKGVFYAPAAEGLGVNISQLTASATISGIVSALCMAPCCIFFKRVRTRLSLTVLSGLYAVSGMMMGRAPSLLWYYACGILQGISSGFLLFFVLQYIIGNWFPAKKGTVLGFVLMSSGIAGMIFNPVLTAWITAYGWRTAYYLQGVVVLIMVLPASLLLLHRSPQEAGFPAETGAESDEAVPQSGAHSAPTLRIAALFALLLLLDLCMALTQHLPNLAVSSGRTAAFGAILVSVSMAGNLTGKIGLGVLNDRLGVSATTVIGASAVGLGCLLTRSANELLVLIGAFFVGVILSVVTLQIPLIYRRHLAPDVYDRIYPTVCSVNIVVSSVSHTLLSLGYNAFGSYSAVMSLAATDMLVCILITIAVTGSFKTVKTV